MPASLSLPTEVAAQRSENDPPSQRETQGMPEQVKTIQPDIQVIPAIEEALARTGAIVETITVADWGRSTPCTDWDARQLLNHLVAVTTRFSAFAEGDDAPRMPSGDVLNNDPAASYRAIAQRAITAWRTHPEALTRTCRLSFGTFDGRTAAAINVLDIVVHGWDLAQALEREYEIPDHLAQVALATADVLVTPDAIRTGQYQAPGRVSNNARPETRLLARVGRSSTSEG